MKPRRKADSPAPQIEPMHRVAAVARALSVSESEVRRLIATGELPALRLTRGRGRSVVIIPESYLRAYVERLKAQAMLGARKWGASPAAGLAGGN